ncbi:MAG TPA: hypothetical protein VF502_07425 [Stellaceae bacterium]
MEKLARRGRPIAAAGLLATLLVPPLTVRGGAAQDPAGAQTGLDEQTSRAAGQSDSAAPVRAFTDERGRSCRVYARAVIIDGEPRTAFATVCRESSGRWVLSR